MAKAAVSAIAASAASIASTASTTSAPGISRGPRLLPPASGAFLPANFHQVVSEGVVSRLEAGVHGFPGGSFSLGAACGSRSRLLAFFLVALFLVRRSGIAE